MPDIFVSPSATGAPSAGVNMPKPGTGRSPGMIRRALSAYVYKPDGVKFETQGDDEIIILLLRKHWFTNLGWVAISALLILSPVLIFPLIIFNNILPAEFSAKFVNFIIYLWYLLTFSYMLVNFIIWYFTVSIVTNERIVDIDFASILHKKFSATRISKVEDITLKEGGFIRSILDFGDVIVQTAGTEVQFLFDAVPHPEQVVRTINGLMENFEEEP